MPPDTPPPPQGAEAHFRALESLYAAAPINRLFDSVLEIPSSGQARISFTIDEICGDDHSCWSRWTMHSPAGTRGGCGIYKVADGKLTYYRDYSDPAEG